MKAFKQTGDAALRQPEIITVNCVCALHDKPYSMYYESIGGRLKFRESVRITDAGETLLVTSGLKRIGKGTLMTILTGSGRFALQVSVDRLDEFHCAWCGDESINYCAGPGCCNSLVCGASIVDGLFTCRASCGARWRGVPLLKVPATESLEREDSAATLDIKGRLASIAANAHNKTATHPSLPPASKKVAAPQKKLPQRLATAAPSALKKVTGY